MGSHNRSKIGDIDVTEESLPGALDAILVVGVECIDDKSQFVSETVDPAGPCNENQRRCAAPGAIMGWSKKGSYMSAPKEVFVQCAVYANVTKECTERQRWYELWHHATEKVIIISVGA